MIGMEFYEILNFTRQAGLALAGASSFWAFLFLWAARRSDEEEKRKVLEWVGNRLLVAFSAGFAAASLSWAILWNISPVFAHEGITLFPSDPESRRAFFITFPVYIVWIVFTLSAFVFRVFRREAFQRSFFGFYAAQFLFASALISLYAWTGNPFGREQLFFYFHGFHSIFTLGTVLTLDFLFLSTRLSVVRQQYLFPFFPYISKIIFLGLGLDFLSVFFVLGQAVEFSARFFMAQTAVGILIINGTFMAGPLTRKILNGLRKGQLLAGKWRYIAGVSGAISITSWTTITFIDYIPHMTFSYAQLLAVYGAVILLAIVVNSIITMLDARELNSARA